ncbi:predicted protein [Plenodomus lingam JN3]|uniref:Predicted protein n=1 Tax=Leptosphaeria maculans (strain JN3 / isolate v23.1.3 / race Av1-4-5-6-7-8) TaxID=985895 RepID=E4ZUI1_LEPMJ|nr:predicted protein [Plenodomus lingam JN3]CBX95060.1 predicted protein [Plenodomus lingam JN3]
MPCTRTLYSQHQPPHPDRGSIGAIVVRISREMTRSAQPRQLGLERLNSAVPRCDIWEAWREFFLRPSLG